MIQATILDRKTRQWLSHPFYSEAVVLGIDVGIEGIGICVRRGPHILYKKTHIFDLPKAEALKDRRLKRSARHARKNRRTRLHRFQKLCAKHGLPWPDEDVLSRTAPFVLRHRAITSRLASPHALVIAIRHLILRRGHDFHAGLNAEFPWGEDATIAAARKWLRTTHIDEETAKYLREALHDLQTKESAKNQEMTEKALAKGPEERESFLHEIHERLRECDAFDMGAQLSEYRRKNDPRFRAAMRGRNIPRRLIESHLREILSRHADMIPEMEKFTAALFLKPKHDDSPLLQKRAKEHAIFHFNRKTPHETAAYWERKRKDCPVAPIFGLPAAKAGENGDPDIRKWNLLKFVVTRRVEIATKGAEAQQVRLPAVAIAGILDQPTPKWMEIKPLLKRAVEEAHPGSKLLPEGKSDANKRFLTDLKDIAAPSTANMRKKSRLAPHTAAYLYGKATADGSDFSPEGVNERLNAIKYYDKIRAVSSGGPLLPQVRFLLGQRAKADGGATRWAVEGKLQRIFAGLAEDLDGKTAPDYIVIECIKDAPRNLKQKAEIEKEQKQRREDNKTRFDGHNLTESRVSSTRRRISLYDQQRGLCPFTGLPLGDPLSPDLELEHLFPQSRGGLSMDINLVLTFRWVNSLKNDRTPRELAAKRPHKDILDWAGMMRITADFKWGSRTKPDQPLRKRDVFTFDGEGFPDFGNTTFTAQLARQLKEEASLWMGLGGDAEEIRKRIATPSGWLAAQARRTWIIGPDGEPLPKDRNQPQHHLVDALVLAHIPPAEGMNSAECGGIFTSQWQNVSKDGVTTRRPLTTALPGLLPYSVIEAHLLPLLGSNPDTLPVEKHRAKRKWAQSLGDSTFWKVDFKTGKTYQRTELSRESKEYTDPESVAAALRRSRIPQSLIPSHAVIRNWLNLDKEDESELKLTDGTPVRSIWKEGGKGSLASPLGWTAAPTGKGGKPERFLSLSLKSEALEIWVAWNGKKWVFLKRRSPDRTALRHLKRFAGTLDQRAPAWMQKHPDKESTHRTLEQIVFGNELPRLARRVALLQRGMELRVSFNQDGSVQQYHDSLPSTWLQISAIRATLEVCLTPRLSLPDAAKSNKSQEWKIGNAAVLLAMLGKASDPAEIAAEMNLTPPPDDPPPHHGGRPRPGNSPAPGQANLWQA